MSDLNTLLERNRSIAAQFDNGDLQIRPRMSTMLLTCVDARVDPAHLFGLGLGDALVIRNGGGRITPAVMGDLGVLGVLGANLPGDFASGAAQPELVVMHHTDCGMGRLASAPIQQQVAERLGLSDQEVAAMAVVDPAATVRSDIERLRNNPGAPDTLVVSGLVYDVSTGKVDEVVPPAPLRGSAVSLEPAR